ncbi:MAG: class I SAM-dependent methyltransferase [Actinomycetota bacterium]|nr:class I SAM-dependent methyltransferase [Actinomycetota bacterium]
MGRDACPLCHSVRSHTIYDGCVDLLLLLPGTFSVVACDGCGLVRTWPQLDAEHLAGYYPPEYFQHTEAEPRTLGAAARASKAVLRAPYHRRYGSSDDLDPPPEPGQRLLDVGCGTGVRLARAAQLGWEAWGVEPDAHAAGMARSRPGVAEGRVIASTLEDAELPAATFQLITLSHVLEHVPDPVQTIALVNRLLTPRGRIRVFVPNFASLERRLFGRHWFGLEIPRHLLHFTPASIAAVLHNGGLEVERLVPQLQAGSLAGSTQLWLRHLRKSRRSYRPSPIAYHLSIPVAAAMAACGSGGVLDVTARRGCERTSPSMVSGP